ncbi:hypothetical protein RchiOBHm_Chr7g0215621 [Rosa chinensis]|uniref:Uncharacterized protein n=1 Tax=Rosa chinensis TaxID=74649 RepID=A0A2P6PBK2_ROSCH|nr:hypothetical protein RchiOBHm_Chr7g0215621 [Rosa chinensis]
MVSDCQVLFQGPIVWTCTFGCLGDEVVMNRYTFLCSKTRVNRSIPPPLMLNLFSLFAAFCKFLRAFCYCFLFKNCFLRVRSHLHIHPWICKCDF